MSKSKYKERIRMGPFCFCVRWLSHSFALVRRYFNRCIYGHFEALEFQDFCDVRLWLKSIINQKYKERIKRDPSFAWHDGFSLSPSRVRVCVQLLILQSSNLWEDTTPYEKHAKRLLYHGNLLTISKHRRNLWRLQNVNLQNVVTPGLKLFYKQQKEQQITTHHNTKTNKTKQQHN